MAGMGPPRSSTRQPNRGLGAKASRILPSTGREGPPPKWPFPGRAPKLWAELWTLPQAEAWEDLHHERVVARYARALMRAEKPDAPAAIMSEVRQLEDRLGLSPMAMLRLGWQIAAGAASVEDEQDQGDAEADVEGAEVAQLDDYRDLYGEGG